MAGENSDVSCAANFFEGAHVHFLRFVAGLLASVGQCDVATNGKSRAGYAVAALVMASCGAASVTDGIAITVPQRDACLKLTQQFNRVMRSMGAIRSGIGWARVSFFTFPNCKQPNKRVFTGLYAVSMPTLASRTICDI
jgi:hypothetical protein